MVLWWLGVSYFGESNPAASQLATFLTQSRSRVAVRFETKSIVQIGDPIIIYENEVAKPVGRIIDIPGGPTEEILPVIATEAVVEFYSSAPTIAGNDYLAYHSTPDSIEWMVQMMLPPKTRDKIGGLIVNAYREHQSELSEILQPIVLKTAQDAADVIRDEFAASVKNRNEQIRTLGDRYQAELVEKELIPMVQDQIWPIVREEAEPLAMDIGREMWARVSVWRFGWRMIYDRSPLPNRNLVEKEFQRFLEQHGSPIIQNHVPDLMTLQQNILARVSENEQVRKVVGQSAGRVLKDAQFQELAADILRDVFINNDKLIETFERNWKTREAQEAMDITNQRLEPTITKIGQTLFGDPENSITPEFSRVLRHRILHKDNRWLVLHQGESREASSGKPEEMRVVPGTTGIENPFHFPGGKLP